MKLLKIALIALSLFLTPLSFGQVVTERIKLTPLECEQQAVLVALEAYKLQGGKVEKEPEVNKNAERVARYIIESNKELLKEVPPSLVGNSLYEQCMDVQGETVLPLVVENK